MIQKAIKTIWLMVNRSMIHLFLLHWPNEVLLLCSSRILGLSAYPSCGCWPKKLPNFQWLNYNWGSYLGTYQLLQLRCGIDNFLIAEFEESVSELSDDEEWGLENGRITVSDRPGAVYG